MTYSLSHLSDGVLLRDLSALVERDRTTTAALLAHLAEVEERRLYLPAAYPSMYDYCVRELGMSEDAACRRIRAARKAREFPAILPALADGRFNLSTVVLLAPHLTAENADELLAAAARRSRAEVQELVAERFPRRDRPDQLVPLAAGLAADQPTMAASQSPDPSCPGPLTSSAPARMAIAGVSGIEPLSTQRFGLQVTIDQDTHDKLRYVQALLGHQVPSGELGEVLDRALDASIRELERQKFGAASKPRAGQQGGRSSRRHIPASIKRAVWVRDEGRCTFVSENGCRCASRTRLEFDHLQPVGRAGESAFEPALVSEQIRLLCRSHNQYVAERVYGAGFMDRKREEARHRSSRRRSAKAKSQHAEAHERHSASSGQDQVVSDQAAAVDVVPWLRALGFRADEARRAAEHCASSPETSLETRVRTAAAFIGMCRFPNARSRIA